MSKLVNSDTRPRPTAKGAHRAGGIQLYTPAVGTRLPMPYALCPYENKRERVVDPTPPDNQLNNGLTRPLALVLARL